MQNGELIAAAEAAGFAVFVTTDRNLKHQRNLADQSLAIVVLLTTSWPRIKAASAPVAVTVSKANLDDGYVEVAVP